MKNVHYHPAWSLDNAIFVCNARRTLAYPYLVYLKSRQDLKIVCFIYVQLFLSVVASQEWRKRNSGKCLKVSGKCLKVSSKIPRFFYFQFVYQVGPRPTLISTICKVNISFFSESEVKIFDRGHSTDMYSLNRKKRYRLWRWNKTILRKKNCKKMSIIIQLDH